MGRKQTGSSEPSHDDEFDAGDEGPPGSGPVPDIIRRMASLGLSGFFMTEGAIRRAFGETVPKDWVDFASEQSERTRKEVIDRVIEEMGRQMADNDPVELMSQFLAGHTIEIEAKLKLTPRSKDDDGPGIRTRVKFDRD